MCRSGGAIDVPDGQSAPVSCSHLCKGESIGLQFDLPVFDVSKQGVDVFEGRLAEADDVLRLVGNLRGLFVGGLEPAHRSSSVDRLGANNGEKVFFGRDVLGSLRQVDYERREIRSSIQDIADLHMNIIGSLALQLLGREVS